MAILKILIPVFVLAILAASFYWAIDPEETLKQERDAMVRDDAITILDATSDYETKFGKFPWEGQKLLWVEAESIVAALVEVKFLEKFPPTAGEIYVGRGLGDKDKTWACFLPISKHERVDNVKLKSLAKGEPMPESGEPSECLNSPNWQNSFCYVCVSK